MPKEVYEKVKHTMFAKGNVPPNHRPVGSERISIDGYIEVKVAEPDKWRLKQRVVYEEAKGESPEGCPLVPASFCSWFCLTLPLESQFP